MSKDNGNGQTYNNVDVAMFIDWENMHGFIRGKANVSALREVAEGYGRLVLAKAYADWREMRFQQDSLVLYKIGFEPVYVPAGFKNNADVKLATDCIDFAYKHPNIGIFILVTGDGDFIHVASALRPLGKKVIVIAQSNNASSRLGDLVDTLLIYEKDVNPVPVAQSGGISKSKKSNAPVQLEGIFKEIVEILQKEEVAPILLTDIKQKLIRSYGKFDQKDYGFEKFKSMMRFGVQKGHFVINTAGLRDWISLPQTGAQKNDMALPEGIDEVFRDMAAIIESSNQPRALLSYVKHSIIKKYGRFDEAVYGFNQFKQLMEEGERQGYFKLGTNDKQIDYASIPPKEDSDTATS